MPFFLMVCCFALFCLFFRWNKAEKTSYHAVKLKGYMTEAVPCQWTLIKSDTEWNFAPCFSFHEYAYQRGYFNAGIDFLTVAAKSAHLPAEV